MVSGAEILTAVAAILQQTCPEVPTLRVDWGTWGAEGWLKARRWPLVLVQYVGGRSTGPGDKLTGQQQVFRVVLGVRELRPDGTEPPAVAALALRVRQALENQDLGLALTPLELVHEGVVTAGAEWRLWAQTYRTIAYEARTGVLTWPGEDGQTREVRLPLFYKSGTVMQLQERTVYERALDGTLRGYYRGGKRRLQVELPYVTSASKEELEAAKAAGPLSFYVLERPGEVWQAVWVEDVSWREERPGWWSGRLVLAEI